MFDNIVFDEASIVESLVKAGMQVESHPDYATSRFFDKDGEECVPPSADLFFTDYTFLTETSVVYSSCLQEETVDILTGENGSSNSQNIKFDFSLNQSKVVASELPSFSLDAA